MTDFYIMANQEDHSCFLASLNHFLAIRQCIGDGFVHIDVFSILGG